MSSRTITWLTVIFVVAFALIGIGHCGYGKLRWMQSLDLASEHIEKEFDDVDHISTDTLAALLDADRSKVLLIDTRAPDEYAVSRIPGALNAQDPKAVKAILETLKTGDLSSIITYCSIGYRSAELAEKLEKDDDVDLPVKNVLGSIFQWANEDRPLETPDGKPATKVHPFNETWGRLLEPAKRLDAAKGVEGADKVEGAK
jgi:rhodanese-related sulfurtransferase